MGSVIFPETVMRERENSPAPDYTTPALVMLWINLMGAFFVLWAVYGLVPVLVLAAAIHHGIARIEARSHRP